MPDATTTLATLKEAVGRFNDERAWAPFHTPKNLAMGLATEAAELMEHFLWVEGPASRELTKDAAKRDAVADELADVLVYLVILSDTLGIDLSDALTAKLAKNAAKYPAEKYRGKFEV